MYSNGKTLGQVVQRKKNSSKEVLALVMRVREGSKFQWRQRSSATGVGKGGGEGHALKPRKRGQAVAVTEIEQRMKQWRRRRGDHGTVAAEVFVKWNILRWGGKVIVQLEAGIWRWI